MGLQIRNRKTNETITLSRDVRDTHPAWVHAQCETESEAELQQFIDQVNEDDYAGRGEDACGISLAA